MLDFGLDIPTWSVELTRLYQIIGRGRQQQAGDVLLQLAAIPAMPTAGDEERVLLLIELSLEGQSVFLWVDETAFIHWIESALPVPDIASLAVELHQVALAWALAPWFDWCVGCGLTPPSVKALSGPVSMQKKTDLVLSLARNDCWLNLYLDAFPPLWLGKMAQAMTADKADGHSPDGDITVDVNSSVGLAHLSVAEITALSVGDVVMATKEAAFEAASLWIAFDQQLIQLRQMDEHQFEVESMMDQLDEDTDFISDTVHVKPEMTVTALPITLVFEIGRMSVPLSTLAQLSVGDVLEAELKTTPEVGVRAQGRLIATASLVRIGDRLGAKITNLFAERETAKQETHTTPLESTAYDAA